MEDVDSAVKMIEMVMAAVALALVIGAFWLWHKKREKARRAMEQQQHRPTA